MDPITISMIAAFGISVPIAVGAFFGLWRQQKERDKRTAEIKKEPIK